MDSRGPRPQEGVLLECQSGGGIARAETERRCADRAIATVARRERYLSGGSAYTRQTVQAFVCCARCGPIRAYHASALYPCQRLATRAASWSVQSAQPP